MISVNEREFGHYLRDLRVKRGLTTRKLEELTGVSNAYVSLIENGKKGIPSPEILKKICNPLCVSYEELLVKAGYLEESESGFDVGIILSFDKLSYGGRALTNEEIRLIREAITRVVED